MSMLQLKHLFINGIWNLKTPLSKDHFWKWFITLNEGGGPLVLSVGWYRGVDSYGRKLFVHSYCFGKCYDY